MRRTRLDRTGDPLVRVGRRDAVTQGESVPGRARAAVLEAVSGIHFPPFWRLLYGVLARDATVHAVAAAARVAGRRRADTALTRLWDLCVWSGWPHQSRAWTNIDASRFHWRVRRHVERAHAMPARRARTIANRNLRIGIAGALRGSLTLSRAHVDAIPGDLDVYLYDTEYDGKLAGYLDGSSATYAPFATTESMAAAIRRDELDLLVPFLDTRTSLALIDLVDTPCVASVPMGSDYLHHPRVGVRIVVQPEADYFVREGRLFCATSRAFFDDVPSLEGRLAYDARDLDEEIDAPLVPWSEREPLMVVHGGLHKIASRPYLEVLAVLLEERPDLRLVYVGEGKDAEAPRAAIAQFFGQRGQSDRVRHEGAYLRFRDETGRGLADAGWSRLVDELRRARLHPDPWPLGGAFARVEAYILGTPVAHMATRWDEAAWGRAQFAIVDVPALDVPIGRALDPRSYLELCRRCLDDGEFADSLAHAQRDVARAALDAVPFWRQLATAYRAWVSHAC